VNTSSVFASMDPPIAINFSTRSTVPRNAAMWRTVQSLCDGDEQ
jgi:hypothetical protein